MSGEQIRAARIARRWSIDTAAAQAGVSEKTWSRAERGEPLRVSTLAKMDRVLQVGLETAPAGTDPVLWLVDGARRVALAPDALTGLSRRDLLLAKALIYEAYHALGAGSAFVGGDPV